MAVEGGPFRFVDGRSAQVLTLLARAPLYRKCGRVVACPVPVGERVVRTTAEGLEETVQITREGQYHVTSPSGERWLLSEKAFFARYRATDILGTYEAEGFCRAFPNPFGVPITILDASGSRQRGSADCLIADTCSADGVLTGEPYLIEAKAFEETHRPIKPAP